jgi:5-methylcytosine-specific restriction endonuclease McrA
MSLFLVSAGFHSHPKVMLTPDAAIGLWVRTGSWLADNDADGFVPRLLIERFEALPQADQLVKAGLWKRARGGWQMLREVPAAPGCPLLPLWSIERTDYRRKIPQWLREQVLERDEHACVLCGATDDLTLDHIHPWSLGGQDTEDNLRVLCRPCNSRKGARV